MTSHVSASNRRSPAEAQALRTVSRAPLPDNLSASGPSTSGPNAAPQHRWRKSYRSRLWWTDLATIAIVVYGTQFLWLGFGADIAVGRTNDASLLTSYSVLSAAIVVLWMWSLSLIDSRSDQVIGTGLTEYVRLAASSVRLFGVIAIVAFLARIDVARGYLLFSLPSGLILLVVGRWCWRQWLNRRRRRGTFCARVLLVGSESSVAHIARELARNPEAGYLVVGACEPSGKLGAVIQGTAIPIMGSVDAVSAAMAACNADTVVVTSTDDLPPHKVKQISWELSSSQQLVLAPSIVDIAGPRIETRPVSGLPLIHVDTPHLSGGQRFTKRMFDLIVTAILVLILSPVFLVVALLVKLTSRGPAFYAAERIGLNGRPFNMYKFRSMREGADAQLADLLAEQGTAEKPLFKIKNDPRITPIGRILRKYSIDELPQLLNVLGGSMSLVGPRPQIKAEVELYSDAARRRLLARPGITGLWQVSGRSSLEWEDAVKLDLYYVENWTLAGDIAILAKTVGAVVTPGDSAH